MRKIDLSKYKNKVKFSKDPIDYARFTMVVYNTDDYSILASSIITPDEYGANDANDLMSKLSPELLGRASASITSVDNIVSSFFVYRFPDDHQFKTQFIMTSKDWMVRDRNKSNSELLPENINVVFNHLCGNSAYFAARNNWELSEKSNTELFVSDVKEIYGLNTKMFNYITRSLSKKLNGLGYMEAVIKEIEQFENAMTEPNSDEISD